MSGVLVELICYPDFVLIDLIENIRPLFLQRKI